jgi:4-pyridoxolactonase
MFWNRGPAGEVRFPCYSVLVDHPDGRFLFDTGYDLEHVERVLLFEKPLQSSAQTVEAQLALVGLRPSDIDAIINSHFHFDHCGGNKLFPQAKTLCHRDELDAALHPEPFERLGYSDLSFAQGFPASFAASAGGAGEETREALFPPRETRAPLEADQVRRPFELVSGDFEIVSGVFLLETPGHTAGHCSLMVELAHRPPLLFTADACYSAKNMEMMCISGFHRDPAKDVRSLARLKSLAAESGAELFFSHDPENFSRYRRAPDFYE